MSTAEMAAIRKTPNVCGGAARIRDTRIAVWVVVLSRKSGRPEVETLADYPTLTQADLDAAWEFYRENPIEIEQSIWLNDIAGNVPDGAAVPAAVIVAGRLTGLDDATICDAFEPPLAPQAVADAWAEYRADPRRVDRDVAVLRRAG